MKLRVQNIVDVLRKYANRYRWLDVFASEVLELTEPSDLTFAPTGQDVYQLVSGGQPVELVLDRSRNLARFRLIKEADLLSGALVGAGLGALLGTAVTSAARSHPAGILLALLVGGLMGAGIAAAQGDGEVPADDNRILTLSFEPEQRGWQVYHGPYRDYAKEALHPSRALG